MTLNVIVAGEGAVLIYFSEQASEQVLEEIQRFRHHLHHLNPTWLKDSIPSFTSLLVEYNPLDVDYYEVSKVIQFVAEKLAHESAAGSEYSESVVELPVYYSEETGLDLVDVATNTKQSVEDVIKVHSETLYQVYAVGFAPGFTYLGTLNQSLVLPRLKTPRLKVPKGSVAIAESQTAIYPEESPGGWHILGNCPIQLFGQKRTPPMNLSVGDKVRFMPISRDEFIKLGGVLR